MGADKIPVYLKSSKSSSKAGSILPYAAPGKKKSSTGKSNRSSSNGLNPATSLNKSSSIGGSSLARLEAKFKEQTEADHHSTANKRRGHILSSNPPPSTIYSAATHTAAKRRPTKETSGVQEDLERLFLTNREANSRLEASWEDSERARQITSADSHTDCEDHSPRRKHHSSTEDVLVQQEERPGGKERVADGQLTGSDPRLPTTPSGHQQGTENQHIESDRRHDSGCTDSGSILGAKNLHQQEVEGHSAFSSQLSPSSEHDTQVDEVDMPEAMKGAVGHQPAMAPVPALPAESVAVDQLNREPHPPGVLQPLTGGNKANKARVRMSVDDKNSGKPLEQHQSGGVSRSASKRLPANWREERLKDARSQQSMRRLNSRLVREPSVNFGALYSQHSFLPPRQPSGIPRTSSRYLASQTSFLPARQPSAGSELVPATRQKSSLQHASTGGSELYGPDNQRPTTGLSAGGKSQRGKREYLAAGLSKKSFRKPSHEQSVSRRQSRMSNGGGVDDKLPSIGGRQKSGVVQASFKVNVPASASAVSLPSISKRSRSKAEKSFRKSAPAPPASYQKMFEAADAAHAAAERYEKSLHRRQGAKCGHPQAAPKGKGKGHKHRKRVVKITLI